jgi:hypothetical protein
MASDEGKGKWSDERGAVVLETPAADVFVFRMTGRMSESFVSRFEASVANRLSGSKVDLFFDTEKMTSYEPSFRNKMTVWHEALKPQTRSAHVLVTSKFVAMAISVVNMVTGGLFRSHSNRRTFDVELDRAVAGAAQR